MNKVKGVLKHIPNMYGWGVAGSFVGMSAQVLYNHRLKTWRDMYGIGMIALSWPVVAIVALDSTISGDDTINISISNKD